MQLANQEAQRFNHDYIGPEHILLGLVKEGSGVGMAALMSMDISDATKILPMVRDRVTPGPDAITMGKLPQTPSAKKVIELAIQEAVKLQNNYVGTEHILLGLIRQEEGIAASVLKELGVTYDQAVLTVQELQGKGASQGTDMGKPITFAWQTSVVAPAPEQSAEEHDALLRERFAESALGCYIFGEFDPKAITEIEPTFVAKHCCQVADEMVKMLRQMRTTNGPERKGECR